MSRVIGLGGKLAAGKDVVADHLVEKYGFVKLGMSDALHEAALKLNPIVFVDFFSEYELNYRTATEEFGYVGAKERFPEYRRFLQVLGTEVGREMFGENVWVNLMASKIMGLVEQQRDVVVTGIRFPNEVDLIDGLSWETAVNAQSVWVKRPPTNALEAVVTHASENSVTEDDFDVILFNTGTIADLHEKVEELIEEG